MGRKPTGDRALTPAERAKRYRDKIKRETTSGSEFSRKLHGLVYWHLLFKTPLKDMQKALDHYAFEIRVIEYRQNPGKCLADLSKLIGAAGGQAEPDKAPQ